MNPQVKIQILLGLVLLGFFPACAKAPPPKTAQQALRRSTAFASLSSFVEVTVEARGKKQSFDAALVMKAPAQLRIEILDDLGQVISRLIADGSQVLWWQAEKDEYITLPQEPNTLKKTLKLPISIEEFIQGMLAGAPTLVEKKYRVLYVAGTDVTTYPARIEWEFLKPKARLLLTLQDPDTFNLPEARKFDTQAPAGARPAKLR